MYLINLLYSVLNKSPLVTLTNQPGCHTICRLPAGMPDEIFQEPVSQRWFIPPWLFNSNARNFKNHYFKDLYN